MVRRDRTSNWRGLCGHGEDRNTFRIWNLLRQREHSGLGKWNLAGWLQRYGCVQQFTGRNSGSIHFE